ncbi:TPA: hypothetical protein DEO28_01420 [Candidatus Dependentiae bacterium]|nr:MAG: hypothetical protein UR14_C0003G0132 [candidate division TM6 bacterium GW2011_GWE2_31_21]KKP53704.1 MAG: hypothetical protein UR43_C0003G0025 [candidate division TM6 bacterium GW2011_GWF2_33_332]HBS48544.1 hypothetical protein [Candidatus Dependentiae bacterium]HBZ73159.1 hypothetical protein [Candidatus Dependentiae bacterium]
MKNHFLYALICSIVFSLNVNCAEFRSFIGYFAALMPTEEFNKLAVERENCKIEPFYDEALGEEAVIKLKMELDDSIAELSDLISNSKDSLILQLQDLFSQIQKKSTFLKQQGFDSLIIIKYIIPYFDEITKSFDSLDFFLLSDEMQKILSKMENIKIMLAALNNLNPDASETTKSKLLGCSLELTKTLVGSISSISDYALILSAISLDLVKSNESYCEEKQDKLSKDAFIEKYKQYNADLNTAMTKWGDLLLPIKSKI